jgi:hypothetical protein
MAGVEQTQCEAEAFLAGASDDRDIHGPKTTGTGGRGAASVAAVETVVWAIELGVGIACLAGAALALRHPRLRLVGAVLLVAGLAAAGHAVVQLLG